LTRAVLIALLAIAAPAAADPGWELHVPERLELAEGTSGTLPIEIAVGKGMAVSKDAPVIVDLVPDGGVTLKRRRLGREDAVNPDADAPRFDVPVRAEAAGDFRIKLHIQFWLCFTRVCRPVDARRTIAIAVSAATR